MSIHGWVFTSDLIKLSLLFNEETKCTSSVSFKFAIIE